MKYLFRKINGGRYKIFFTKKKSGPEVANYKLVSSNFYDFQNQKF